MTITRVPTSKSSKFGSKGDGAPGRGVVSSPVNSVMGALRDLPKFLSSDGDESVVTSALDGSGVTVGKTTPAVRVRAWIGEVLSVIRGASLPESLDLEVAEAFESFNDSRLESSEESGRFWLFSSSPSWKRWRFKILFPWFRTTGVWRFPVEACRRLMW